MFYRPQNPPQALPTTRRGFFETIAAITVAKALAAKPQVLNPCRVTVDCYIENQEAFWRSLAVETGPTLFEPVGVENLGRKSP